MSKLWGSEDLNIFVVDLQNSITTLHTTTK